MIAIECSSRRHRDIARRIEETAHHYGALAARKLDSNLPAVRILVTDKTNLIRTVCRAEADLAGATSRTRRTYNAIGSWWHDRHVYGSTVYDKHGILIAINSSAHHGNLGELDRTVIHELAHAVQLGARGARDRHATYTRMRLGVIAHDQRIVNAYMREMDIREQQAINLEVLA